jgi:hypothetical protein
MMALRFPRLRHKGNIRLFVVAADPDGAPGDRWFRSLPDALRAFDRLEEQWKPRAWIIEYHDQPTYGGISVVRNVVHMRDGRRTNGEPPPSS